MSYTDFGIHEIRVGQIHRRPTRPKIRVGLVLHVTSYAVPAPMICAVKLFLQNGKIGSLRCLVKDYFISSGVVK